jgi:[amino group carrier protein]-L-2-aminoadipate 6-kinase
VLVVKIGGSEGIDPDVVCDDVAALARDRVPLVVVHGGSHQTTEVATRLGHPPQFLTSPSGYTSRRTDRRTLDVFEMVCCGLLNKGYVERLQRRGVRAIGLSGVDGPIWEGKRKDAIRAVENGRTRVVRDDLTGTVERVNAALLGMLLDAGYVPVLTPPALAYTGEAVNVDADRAAAATAAALGADDLVILSNVAGLLREFPDPASLVARVRPAELDDAFTLAAGRMRTKLLGAREALEGGVPRVVLGDARIERPVSRALAGQGTVVA